MGVEVYVSPSSPEPGQTVKCYWRYENTWTKGYQFKIEFYLDERLIKTVNLGYLYSGQSKEGSFSFTAPSSPGTHTLKAVSYLYTYGQWVDEDEATATFTVVGAEPKAKIEKVEVKEYASGRTLTVSNKGSVTVNEERVRITATVRNIGSASGTIYVELFLDGTSKGRKSISLSPYNSGSTYWDLELTVGSHTVTIKAGH